MAPLINARLTAQVRNIFRTGAPRAASAADYLALLKPRVMSLVVFTGLAGIAIAPGPMRPLTAVVALLCISLGAGGSAALNMAFDSDIDARMARTRSRPIPMGRVARRYALVLGWALSVGAVAITATFVNVLAAALLAATIALYIGVYTLWLKRRTTQNIVIGGLAGALPPAIGWAAMTGSLSAGPLLLVLIIFLWTPAHFWALALFRVGDYERVGVPMMPAVHGKASTRRHIMGYSLALFPAGLLPIAVGVGGPLYLIAATAMGLAMVWQSRAVMVERNVTREPEARRLFSVSLLYVLILFAALIIERTTGIRPFGSWV